VAKINIYLGGAESEVLPKCCNSIAILT